MATKINIQGLRELDAALAELPRAVERRVMGNAVRAGARVIASAAKQGVPVDTGALKKSIVVRAGKRKRPGLVTALVGFLRPRSRIAHLVEYGTSHSAAKPFMRPALDGHGQEAAEKMKEALRAGIEREAAKLKR